MKLKKCKKRMSLYTVSNKARRLKLYQRKHLISLAVKVKLLLFLTYYFKGQFLVNGCYISFDDSKGNEF